MSKTFRPWRIDQPLLLPVTVQDFVDEDHLARFVVDLVVEHLDLREIEAAYASERGQPPFDPAMRRRCCSTPIAAASTRRGGLRRRRASASTS